MDEKEILLMAVDKFIAQYDELPADFLALVAQFKIDVEIANDEELQELQAIWLQVTSQNKAKK